MLMTPAILIRGFRSYIDLKQVKTGFFSLTDKTLT